jgi:uncharacterized protein YecT (DUF1311 family)
MRILLILTIILSLCLLSSAIAFAEDDEWDTPGLEACLDDNPDYVPTGNCFYEAYLYWDKILNINYKKAKDECKKAGYEELCLKSLLTSQRNWLAYRDSGKTAIYDLMGYFRYTDMFAPSFLFEETRNQAKVLERLKRPYY